MVTIVTEFNGDNKVFSMYWLPLIFKHGEVEFIVRDTGGLVALSVPNLKVLKTTLTEAVRSAKNDFVFITDMSAVPTYETMVYLTGNKGKNTMVNPKWHSYMKSDNAGQVTEKSFSVLKKAYTGQTKAQYVKEHNPTIYSDCEVYFVK